MSDRGTKLSRATLGLAFLAPNIIGVMTFVVFPVAFAIVLAFTNWDLKLHNQFKPENHIQFVGLGNFYRLFTQENFFQYFGNTLFLMMATPFAIGGSLLAAILLSKDTRGGGGRVWAYLLSSAVFFACIIMLASVGAGGTAMTILIAGLVCGILILGMTGGVTVYRTLFYTPHFVLGAPTFILWKNLMNPYRGPINKGLQPVLNQVAAGVNHTPPALVQAGLWAAFALIALLMGWTINKLYRMWRDGDLGNGALVLPVVFLCLPAVLANFWSYTQGYAVALAMVAGVILLVHGGLMVARGRLFTCAPSEAAGSGLVLGLGVMVAQFTLLGLGAVMLNLPAMAADGLEAPGWYTSYAWAKPSMMIIGLWGAIGSNNMLLYLAALTNVPADLYEAADIDGAGSLHKFWHITWPQLAPTTFFIAVMSVIGGLQGGFEMARVLTQGGPALSTTTLSYFIYQAGFETGRLSFAAATAWVLFILVFSVTMFNWKFGNRYVNE